MRIHRVQVLNKEGSRAINKPEGSYITCELQHKEDMSAAAAELAQLLLSLLPEKIKGTVLVVGLGNGDAAPDALGSQVAKKTYATRHLLAKQQEPGLGDLCVLAPGVLGLSGIETAEIIIGVCSRLRPAALLVVDSLAAASVSRVGTTVQLADTGICPGSGIGCSRPALNREVLGCPVIAIGVPTVVDTAAIISETLGVLKDYWQSTAQILPPDIDDQARAYTEQQLLQVFRGQLMVTPTDIDGLTEEMGELIAGAIAIALHPDCTAENYQQFLR